MIHKELITQVSENLMKSEEIAVIHIWGIKKDII
jgi:hypothetical protein